MLRPIFSTQLDAILNSPEITENSLTIYPNPTKDILNVSFGNGQISPIYVYNQLGQLITTSVTDIIDLSPFNAGVYFISSPSYTSKVYKVIKQ
jgi:hypothetical protein